MPLILLLVIVAFFILWPFVLIWNINVLFDLDNPYNFTHWFAALIAMLFFVGGSSSSSSK